MRFLLLAFPILINIIPNLSGQTEIIDANKYRNLYLDIKSIGFVKNKEYFNPQLKGLVFMGYMYKPYYLTFYRGYGYLNPNIEGYTLIGNFIQPSLIYYPLSKFSIRVGAHILNYSGYGKFSELRPLIAAKLHISDKTTITLGALDGSDQHRLFDPIFDSEKTYSEFFEEGVQFLTENDHFFNDTWIDWENFILKSDTHREVLTIGESFRYTSGKLNDLINFTIPFQLQAKHKGGQISNYNEHLETYINLAAGLNINYYLRKGDFGILSFDFQHFLYYDNSPYKVLSFDKGYSNWYRLNYSYKKVILELAYWKSHNYYSPNGNLIYSSISGYLDNTILPDRSLLSTSLYVKTNPAKSIELYLGLDNYYDLNLKEFYSAVAFHISFKELVFLKKYKN